MIVKRVYRGVIEDIAKRLNVRVDNLRQNRRGDLCFVLRPNDDKYGPDDHNDSAKVSTTAIVRAKAFPQTAKQAGYGWSPMGAILCGDSNTQTAYRVRKYNAYFHFWAHVKKAFLALGLEWNAVNTLDDTAVSPFDVVEDDQ